MYVNHSNLFDDVLTAVLDAGRLAADPAAVQNIRAKGAADFVTNVDVLVQETLKAKLAALTPEAQFMGEEQDNSGLDLSKPCWILDPVDGTTNLIHRYGMSAVSLALAEEGQVVFGVVYNPFHKECFTARLGQGSFLNGQPIHVSEADALVDSLISVGTTPGKRTMSDASFRTMRNLFDRCQDVRRTGSASLDLSYVACGRQEGYVELAAMPWDYAAGWLIVTEAGGAVTAPDGSPLPLDRPSGLLASNGRIHQLMLEQVG